MSLAVQTNTPLNAQTNNGITVWSEAVGGGTLYVSTLNTPNGEALSVASAFAASSVSSAQLPTTITTVGAGTLIAADLLGGLITRSGPTQAFTDTTDTAALIQAAWTGGSIGSSFNFTERNTTAFAETVAGGTGVTLSPTSISIPANSTASFTAVWTGTNTITITLRSVSSNVNLPAGQITLLNATTGSLPAGAITGAGFCSLVSSNATPGAQLVRTAAQMLADIPNGAVGTTWIIQITNTGAGTLTLTTDAGSTVTLSGTMTVPQNTTRTFVATINTATTATITAISVGTYS